MDSKLVRLVPNGTNLELKKINFQYIFKKPHICPTLGPNPPLWDNVRLAFSDCQIELTGCRRHDLAVIKIKRIVSNS